jgi:integrase
MSAQYLYRRPSGVYFVRLCVPARLKQAVGKGEIHRSTGCRDYRLAKIVAAEIAAHWHRALEAVRSMDPAKIKAGSISLLGSGFVGLMKAAGELGAEPADLARRLADRGAHFIVEANAWSGWALDSIHDDAEYERDEFDSLVMVLPPRDGRAARFTGRLRIRYVEDALKAAQGQEEICQFLVWPSNERGFVVDLPGQLVVAGDLQVAREDVEALRESLASEITGAEKQQAAGPRPASTESGMRFSELAQEFLKRKKPFWKTDQLERKTDQCKAFRELMDDPPLAQITRPIVRRFSDELARVPENRGKVRRKFGLLDADFRRLIELADAHGLPRITVDTHRRFLDGISEVFEWAVNETYIATNPARALGTEIERSSGTPKTKDQDQRAAFSGDDLAAIFGAEWFAHGTGRKTPQGTFHSYRPHYFWLPLLALHCGGRLNELAQVYVDDIVSVEGIWCLDFNLNAPDKLDLDEADPAGKDKSLKTINAQRQVPIHSRLIELGFVEYVVALREAGHQRLFPELHFDARKGYGKAAGSWFNERFLGRRLKIERDGRKTFHSFRHNFATALGDADVLTSVKADLMGHSRSTALSETRYDKGRKLQTLKDAIEQVRYELPPIASLSIADALQAIGDAQTLKKSHRQRSLRDDAASSAES